LLFVPLLLVVVSAFAPGEPALALQARFFVNDDATGDGTGESWENAFTDLQAGLDAAFATTFANPSNTVEIWVASGTYKPTVRREPTDPLTARFKPLSNWSLFGGFAGTESSLAERDLANTAPSILSGDLGPPGVAGNVYNVLLMTAGDDSTVLDGFVVTGGNASSFAETASGNGGGMSIENANPTLRNIHFTGNFALIGGGLDVLDGHPTLENVTFSDNEAKLEGGGAAFHTAGTLRNVTFSGNTVTGTSSFPTRGKGGGLFGNSTGDETLTLSNVTFFDNDAVLAGGGFWLENSQNLVLRNGITWDNTAAGVNNDFARVTTTPDAGITIVNAVMEEFDCEEFVPQPLPCTAVTNDDPLLQPLAANGGSVPTNALAPGSSAIDHGDNTVCTDDDPRGVSRPFEGDGVAPNTCDNGAYEFVPYPQVRYDTASSTTGEAGSATIAVELSAPYIETVSVNFAATGGTATAGIDHTLAPGTLTFTPGDTAATFAVPVRRDFGDEPNETVRLALSAPVRATIGTPSVHTLTIVDDDPARTCNGKKVAITGTPGDDTLVGTPGADVFEGLGGKDRIVGRGGDDTICGGGGDDTLVGGAGNDVILGGNGADLLNGIGGSDTLRGGGGADTLNGQGGDDALRGDAGADTLRGGGGSDDVAGGAGPDRLAGNAGPGDRCKGGPGADALLPNAGCEVVSGVP